MVNLSEDMRLAAEWLDEYDGTGSKDMGKACQRIAMWLRATADKQDVDAEIREIARNGNISLADARRLFEWTKRAT